MFLKPVELFQLERVYKNDDESEELALNLKANGRQGEKENVLTQYSNGAIVFR